MRFPCDRQGWKMLVHQRWATSPCFHQHIQCGAGLGNIHVYILIQISVCGVASAMHSIITLQMGCVTPQHPSPADHGLCTALVSPLLSVDVLGAECCKAPALPWHWPCRRARRHHGCSHGRGIPGARWDPQPHSLSRTTVWLWVVKVNSPAQPPMAQEQLGAEVPHP